MGYLLLTVYPLCSSKSYCLTLHDVQDKINDILDQTERYYRLELYEPRIHPESDQYEGVHLIQYDETKTDIKKMFGFERMPRDPPFEPKRNYYGRDHGLSQSDDQEDEAETGMAQCSSDVA